MKKLLVTVLGLVLLLAALPLWGFATEEAPLSVEEVVISEAAQSYTRSRRSAGKSSFHGKCGLMVSHQLYNLGINRNCIIFDGNDQYDYYCDLEVTSGGYYISAYPAGGYSLLETLQTITHNGTQDVRNILVGFQWTNTEAGAKYGHVMFINGIIDGTVYFVESFHCSLGGPEGTVIRCSIEEFANYFDKWTVFEGAIHFGNGSYYDVCPSTGTDVTVQTRYDTVLRSEPAVIGQKGCARLRSVAAGERLRATGIYNDGRSQYYRVQTNSGVGFISAGAVSLLQANEDGLFFTDLSISRRIALGGQADFEGTVTDPSGNITSLEVCITDAREQLVRREVLQTQSYTVQLAPLKDALLFDLLDPGFYRMEIYAGRACQAIVGSETVNCYTRVLLDSRSLQVGGVPQYNVSAPEAPKARRDGWFRENGTWYCYQEGRPCTGWWTYQGVRYYLQPDGAVTTGKQTVDGKQLYFSATGALVTGWLTLDGSIGYRAEDGTAVTGWQTIDGKLFCFERGILLTDRELNKDNKVYILDCDGVATEKPTEKQEAQNG